MQQVPVSDTSDTGLTDNFDSQDLSVEPCLYTERSEAAELTQAYMTAERLLPVLQLLPDNVILIFFIFIKLFKELIRSYGYNCLLSFI